MAKTCEEYVVQELQNTKEENESLKDQLKLCQCALNNVKKELEFIMRIIKEHSNSVSNDECTLSVFFTYYDYEHDKDKEQDFKHFKTYFNIKESDKIESEEK